MQPLLFSLLDLDLFPPEPQFTCYDYVLSSHTVSNVCSTFPFTCWIGVAQPTTPCLSLSFLLSWIVTCAVLSFLQICLHVERNL